MHGRDWRAALEHRDGVPTYRFRGHLRPEELPRTPLLNSAEAMVEDGIATMRLYDPIDSWGGEWGVSAKEFGAVLDQLGDASEIRLHINSPGGEVFEAIAMMNMLRAHSAKVTAIVDGIAASSASFIAASADETIMGRNSEMMVHDAWGLSIGNAADMRKMADLLDHLSDNIASVYAEKSGGDVADWRTTMLAETWLSAQDAVDQGLADSVAPAPEAAEEPAVKTSKAQADPTQVTDDGADIVRRFMAKRHATRATKVA